MKINYIKDRLRFDVQKFNFREILLSSINESLIKSDRDTIKGLDLIHTIPDIEKDLEKYRQIAFKTFRSDYFKRIYKKFGAWLIENFYSEKALIQKTPTIRIHLANGRSVSFHTDEWYGHGDVNSFWIPLTKVGGVNSLQIARDVEISRNFKKKVIEEKMSLDEINTNAIKICEPVIADYGDLIIFNRDIIHGTVINKTNTSRVSFDFRIAPNDLCLGNKPISNYFFYEDLFQDNDKFNEKSINKRALLYTGTCGNVSSKNQSIFIEEFSKINNIDIVAAESEIIIFDHCPVLIKYIINPEIQIDQILLYGVDLLPKNKEDRFVIYEESLKNKIKLIFASEDKILQSNADIEKIENLIKNCSKSFY